MTKDPDFNDDEQQVLDWALNYRFIEPFNDRCRATCKGLVKRGLLKEREGFDPRFTVFVPTPHVEAEIVKLIVGRR